MSQKVSMRVLPALLLAGLSGTAAAAGFQLFSQGSGLGNAYAGSAAKSSDASTIWYNPAGMTQLQAREVSAGLTAARPVFKFNDDGSRVGVFNLYGDGGDAGQWGFIPNGYLSWAVNKDLYVGLGVGAPFGQATKYDKPWKGSAQSDEFDIKTININPSIAYRVNEMFSIGGGVSWQKIEADYYKQLAVAPGYAGVKSHLSVDDDAWGWNIGILFTPSPSTKVGLSYRSAIQYHTTGTEALASDGTALANRVYLGAWASGVESNVKADLKVPATAILSATQKISDQWELLGDLSWTGWDSIKQVDIYHTNGVANGKLLLTLPTEFQNTWRAALGANYSYSDAWKFMFGVAYDKTPVKNAETRLAALPDNDRIWWAVGTQWKPAKEQTLELGFMYEYIQGANINHYEDPAKGLLRGDYNGSGVWVIGGQYSLAF